MCGAFTGAPSPGIEGGAGEVLLGRRLALEAPACLGWLAGRGTEECSLADLTCAARACTCAAGLYENLSWGCRLPMHGCRLAWSLSITAPERAAQMARATGISTATPAAARIACVSEQAAAAGNGCFAEQPCPQFLGRLCVWSVISRPGSARWQEDSTLWSYHTQPLMSVGQSLPDAEHRHPRLSAPGHGA